VAILAVAVVACGSTTAGSQEIAVNDSMNGQSVSVHAGDFVTVSLGSTYWAFGATSDASVIQPQGDPVISPAPLGSCVPGAGCGTATARFKALKLGNATITATRLSCGEAMRCVGSAGLFQVTIVVS